MSARAVTVLRSKGPLLAKRFTDERDVSYEDAKHFVAEERRVEGLRDLARLLHQLQHQPRACVVRGAIRPGADPDDLLRRLHGEGAGLVDVPRQWLAFDVDGLWWHEVGPQPDPQDLHAQAELVRRALPPACQDVGAVFQWSSRHGRGGAQRAFCHVWVWLSQPLSGQAARAMIGAWRDEGRPWLDPALCSGAQIHYTASPLFEGKEQDPLPGGRVSLLEGEPLDVGEAEEAWERAVQARAERKLSGPAALSDDDVAVARSALEVLDPDEGYVPWLDVGRALHHRFQGAEAALDLWTAWSEGGAKYVEGECAYKWASFKGVGVTFGSLMQRAMATGWRPPVPESRAPRRPTQVRADAAWDPGEPPPWDAPPPGRPPRRPEDAPTQDADDERLLMVGGDKVWWEFGEEVLQCKADEDGTVTRAVLGSKCWPEAVSYDVTSGDYGVLIRYRTPSGIDRHTLLPASAWSGPKPAERAAGEVMGQGARILPGKGAAWVMALGQWYERQRWAPRRPTVSRAGWHLRDEGNVYVNGERVYGERWQWIGDELRGKVKGSPRGLGALCSTPALALAVATALAGALLIPLDLRPWGLHLYGRSSSGKSSAALLAAAIWYDPDAGMLQWKDTANALEFTLEPRSGAVVVIDELKLAKPWEVGDFIHRLSDGQSKLRALQSGKGVHQRRKWSLTMVSTGEVSTTAYMGRGAQGGQAVRCADIELDAGEGTESAQHAHEIARWARANHGAVGDAWARHLTGLGPQWARLGDHRAQLLDALGDMDKEVGRVADNFAAAAAAWDEARAAGIISGGWGDGAQLLAWAMAKVTGHRSHHGSSPEERLWLALLQIFESEPARFPAEREYEERTGQRNIIGIWKAGTMGAGGTIYTTREMLAASGLLVDTGAGVDAFLAWARESGVATWEMDTKEGIKRSRVAGLQRRWISLLPEGGGV
jgi:hypothetical protein